MPKHYGYKYALLGSDLALINLAYLMAHWIYGHAITQGDLIFGLALAFFAAVIFQSNHLYKMNIFLERSLHTVALMKSMMYPVLIYAFAGFITRFQAVSSSRLTFLYFAAASLTLLFLYRVLLFPFIFRKLARSGPFRRNLLVVGTGKSARNFAEELEPKSDLGLNIVGFVDDTLPIGASVLNGYKNLGRTQNLTTLARSTESDEIVIALDNVAPNRLLTLISSAKESVANVKVVSPFFSAVNGARTAEQYTLHPAVSFSRRSFSDVGQLYQRGSDIIISAMSLILLSPLFLVISLLIKLTSSGKVFYKQERVGKEGRLFRMLKFRSMYELRGEDKRRQQWMIKFIRGGAANGHTNNKVVDSSRITPVGRIIRKFSLDELPQLWNVLKGDMSLVGPRPSLPYEYKAYKDWHCQRHKALPGCTGFWQVYGRGRSSFDDMVIMDLYMIENMSPWMYMQLLLKTVPVLAFGRGGK